MSTRVLRKGVWKMHALWGVMHVFRHGTVNRALWSVRCLPARATRILRIAGKRQRWNMAWLVSLACCGLLTIGVGSATAEDPQESGNKSTASQAGSVPETDADYGCDCCHFCDIPTVENRCLLTCNRRTARRGEIYLHDQQGPGVIILDELEDVYLPVPFDHKGHAQMAEMARGCITCHHYTPEGQQHPDCKTCHEVADAEATIDKPGLRGAYHQQCLNCHREWINEKDCDLCHREKAGRMALGDTETSPTAKDILRLMHPPIPEPETDIYRRRSQQITETQVVFRHREHVHRFGLRCVECHHEPSCARCHTGNKEQEQPRTLTEHHRPCIQCHRCDMDLAGREAGRCGRCHWRDGQPKPERFEHATTGWTLGRFHEDKSCRVCHVTLPFAKLSSDCNKCHSNWSPSVFDHRVTGQMLDENHADNDCELCHIERKFDRPPTCNECHDEEDDGIAFPATRPGSTAAPK